MDIKITKNQAIASAVTFLVGGIIGMFGQKQYDISHTPEEKIRQLSEVTAENKASKKALKDQLSETNKAIDALRRTKKEYQDEIRPELESKIRKELEDYISKADATYEKAKHDNDMADLKLELAKQYRKSKTDRDFEEFLWRY